MTITTTQHISVIYPADYLPGIKNDPALPGIVSRATEAVKLIYSSDWYFKANPRNKRLIKELFDNVSQPLFTKGQFRPLVVGRALCYHSLKNSGWSHKEIGELFKVDRTTVYHGLDTIRDRKFKPDVLEAFDYYNEVTG